MRDILFRGKRIDNGEWVEGDFVHLPHGVVILANGYSNIDPETVGQYTGLEDKNGKKIFEGDIVEGLDYTAEDGGYGIIGFEEGAFDVSNNDICGTFYENYWGKDFEVIGNVHDHPELVGGGGMKTKEIIEMLTGWSNDCHVWFDFDGHKANAAILLREAAHKLRENAVQGYEIESLKKLIGELRKELAEREETPGWISVEERMPEKMGELCLVYRKSGDINLSVYFNHYWNYGDVTHWMPIPEPPNQPEPEEEGGAE